MTLAVIAVLLAFAACRERFTSFYADLEEAREEGGVQKGWVPSFLPPSSTRIHERHDLDTNEVWGAFEFKPDEAEILRERLTPLARSDLAGLTVRSPGGGVDWWPKELTGALPNDETAYWDVLIGQDKGFFIIFLQPKRGRGLFLGPSRAWQPPDSAEHRRQNA